VEHAGDSLLLRAFVERVEITDGTRVIAVHQRCYGREQDILDVFHYLPLLKQRPGAFDHAKPLKMWNRPAVLDCYLSRLRDRLSPRTATIEFIRVMELCVNHTLDEVATAVEQAMVLGSLGADTVAYLLRTNRMARQPTPAAILTSAPACPSVQDRDLSPACPSVQDRDLSQYDCFIRR